MKKFFVAVSAILLSVNLWAQAPQSFSYQAVVRGAKNELVANKPVGMKISLLHGSEKGKAVYVETHKPTSNDNGLVSIAIGGGTKDASSNAFASIDWSKGPYFVQTETDVSGGTNYSLTSVSQLLSVPYAMYAKTAESIVGGNSGSFGHYIGEQYGGGVVFHVWKDAQGVEHGLVVATTDQGSAQVWSNVADVEIGAKGRSSLDGLSNSLAIVNQPGHTTSAAKVCLDLVSGGFEDWYLPAKNELMILYNNYYTVSRSLLQITNFSPLSEYGYTSSTESNNMFWYLKFDYGEYATYTKSNKVLIRAVRAF